MAFVESTMEALVTSDRTTGQTVLDSDGKVKNALHNLIPNCDLSDTGDWTHDNLDSVAASGTSPSGKTAYLLTEDSSAGNHRVYDAMSFTGGGTYSLVVDVKANGRDTIKLSYSSDAYGSSVRWEFDLGAVSVTQETGGTEDSAAITLISDGWYRCVMTAAATATDTASRVSIFMTDSGTTSYTGDGASGVYLSRPRVYKSAIHGYSGTDPQGMQLATDGSDYVETTSGPVYQLGRAFDGNAACLGMQSFEGRTNLETNSNDFSVSWSKTRSVVAQGVSSPDGTPNGWTLTDDSSTGTNDVYLSDSFTVSTSSDYTYSVYLKSDQLSWATLRAVNFTTPSTGGVYFDLDNGSVGTASSGITGLIEDVGNGWYRCSITFTTDASDTVGTIRLHVAEADNDHVVDLDGTSSIHCYGSQMEAGAFPTPYIPTLSAAVARGADDPYLATSSFGFNATEGTVVVTFSQVAVQTDTRPWALSDGTANNRIQLNTNSANLNYQVTAGGVSQVGESASVVTANTEINSAVAYKANDFAYSNNGGTVLTDTSGSVPSVTTFYLTTGYVGVGKLNGYLKKVTYYPSRLIDATLEEMST